MLNVASSKALRSRMSPRTVRSSSPSRAATIWSWPSWRGELSNTVTRAPAAARIGPCWPPPEARHNTSLPVRSVGSQERLTGSRPMRIFYESPMRARSTSSILTGLRPLVALLDILVPGCPIVGNGVDTKVLHV